MVVVTSDGVAVTDPVNAVAAKNMFDEIRKITDKPVKFVIYSHNHWDHIGGAKIFKDQGAKIVQHELAAQATRPRADIVPADDVQGRQAGDHARRSDDRIDLCRSEPRRGHDRDAGAQGAGA